MFESAVWPSECRNMSRRCSGSGNLDPENHISANATGSDFLSEMYTTLQWTE